MNWMDVETDVLVIGGGGAGLLAAIEARKKGVDVALVCKKETGKSGCTPYAVTNITLCTPESEGELFRQMVEVGGHLNDQELLDVFVRQAATIVPGLRDYGVPLAVAPPDHYHLKHYPHGPQKNLPSIYNVQPSPGRPLSFNLSLPLRETAERAGVRLIDNAAVSRILVVEGCAAGAVAIDQASGDLFRISSKTVVLATGGSARIYARSDNPPDLTGDGFNLAFEAGADLINMEFLVFNPLKISDEVREMIRLRKPNEKLLAVARAHYNLGGVRTNTRAESTLQNLYAAGEVADGLLGAARLGGTALADAIVFGTISGREAGERASHIKLRADTTAAAKEEEQRILGLAHGKEITPADLQKQVKSLMWNKAGIAKDKQSLDEAAKELSELTGLDMQVKDEDPKELAQAVEARSMARVAELIVLSSQHRRETRGQFWRLDYPEADNANCLCNVVLSGRNGMVEVSEVEPATTRINTPPPHPLVGSGCFDYLTPPD